MISHSRLEAVRRNFDAQWYRETYLAGDPREPAFEHYLGFGAQQGNSPNPEFDEAFYRAHYPDVRRSIEEGRLLTAFDHYLLHGSAEGRLARPQGRAEWLTGWGHLKPLFDPDWYARTYGVEKRRAFDHYIEAGARRGHSPNGAFDEGFYLGFYEDVRRTVEGGRFLCGFEHYVVSGRVEGRIPKHDLEKTLEARFPFLIEPIGMQKAAFIAARLKPLPAVANPSGRETVWFLFPVLNPDIFFGGYRAALELAIAFARSGRLVKFVICDDPQSDGQYASAVHSNRPIGQLIKTTTVLNRAKITSPIEIGPNDRIIAYSAWEAHLAHDLAQLTNGKRFAFLIQEYEPIFHEYSSEHAIVAQAYDLPHYAIFNSKVLQEYFAIQRIGIFKSGRSPSPRADYAVFEHALVRLPAPDREAMRRRRVRKLALYARPEAHATRNLFPLAWLALERAVDQGLFDANWEFHGIGALKQQTFGNSRKLLMQVHSKFDEAAYVNFLQGVDLGISLMYAPHPGLVAYEMAQAGARVVTNVFGNRTAEYLRGVSENLIPCDASIESILAGIRQALQGLDDWDSRIRAAKLEAAGFAPSSWSDIFDDRFLSEELCGLTRRDPS